MAGNHPTDVEKILNRARSDRPRPAGPEEYQASTQHFADPQAKVAGYAVRSNRRGTRRKVSTFNVVIALFLVGTVVVIYISNVITVNRLAAEINVLQAKHDRIMNANSMLVAEIDKKTARERITRIAMTELGLQHPKEQPLEFRIESAKLPELRQIEK